MELFQLLGPKGLADTWGGALDLVILGKTALSVNDGGGGR